MFSCKDCHTNFKRKLNYEMHLISTKHKNRVSVSNKILLFTCSFCNKSFSHSSSLSRHKQNCIHSKTNMDTLQKTAVGTQGRLHQFRPHPDYPREFWHNGTRCRWFLDTEWAQTDVQTRQGIICRLETDQWVVVDKI